MASDLQQTVRAIRGCDSEANPDANDEGQKQKRDGGQEQEAPFPEGPGAGDDPPATAAEGPAGGDRSAAGGAEKGVCGGGIPRCKVPPQGLVDVVTAVAVRVRAFPPGRHVVSPDEALRAFGAMDLQHASSPARAAQEEPPILKLPARVGQIDERHLTDTSKGNFAIPDFHRTGL